LRWVIVQAHGSGCSGKPGWFLAHVSTGTMHRLRVSCGNPGFRTSPIQLIQWTSETTNHQQYPELAGALFVRAGIATMIILSLPDVWIESVPP
jgi:hypothetical protein